MAQVVHDRIIAPAEREAYALDGFLVIPGLVNQAALDPLREEIFAILMAETGLSREELCEARSHDERLRQSQAYLRGSMIDALINGDEMRSVASQLIGGPAVRYNPFTALKGRGGGTFDFHQDNNYTQHRPALGSLNIWVALVDMTEDNGCLRMVPGSHEGGTLAAVDAGDGVHRKLSTDVEAAVPLVMNAGDAVAFTRLTVHGSGPNRSDAPRIAYALQYHRDDVEFLDEGSREWRKLTDFPRFQTPPLDCLEPLRP